MTRTSGLVPAVMPTKPDSSLGADGDIHSADPDLACYCKLLFHLHSSPTKPFVSTTIHIRMYTPIAD
jgi:hypothetical protein